jgi:hypothetical protein
MSLDISLTIDNNEVYDSNITHNLSKMAREVSENFYKALWRPEEINITQAFQLVPILSDGLKLLLCCPEKYKEYNPDNGWGSYNGLCDFVYNYIKACNEHPDANVKAWR